MSLKNNNKLKNKVFNPYNKFYILITCGHLDNSFKIYLIPIIYPSFSSKEKEKEKIKNKNFLPKETIIFSYICEDIVSFC